MGCYSEYFGCFKGINYNLINNLKMTVIQAIGF